MRARIGKRIPPSILVHAILGIYFYIQRKVHKRNATHPNHNAEGVELKKKTLSIFFIANSVKKTYEHKQFTEN